MASLDRRDWLKLVLCGAVGGAGLGALRARMGRSVFAAGGGGGFVPGAKKVLFMFLRGGNDGVNAVIPSHDADYTQALRPTVWIPPAARLDLAAGGAAFHPALAKLKEVYDLGQVAALHRVGYAQSTLSHFASQQYWETGKPFDDTFTEGIVSRWVDQFGPAHVLPAISVADTLQMLFNGSTAIPHVPSLAEYDLTADAATAKIMGSAGKGLIGRYEGSSAAGEFDDELRASGILMTESLDQLASLPPHTSPASWYPTADADLTAEGLPVTDWARDYFSNLRDATHILQQTDCRIAGIQLEGFDVHASQGGVSGAHADLLHAVAHGIRSVRLETVGGLWDDLLVVCLTEFGRTSAENGSQGTDHGKATALFAAGGGVTGGVYNCDPATWPSGATLFSDNGKYVAHRTDYRAVLAEAFERHLGVPTAGLSQLLPGWSSLSGPEFQYLGYL